MPKWDCSPLLHPAPLRFAVAPLRGAVRLDVESFHHCGGRVRGTVTRRRRGMSRNSARQAGQARQAGTVARLRQTPPTPSPKGTSHGYASIHRDPSRRASPRAPPILPSSPPAPARAWKLLESPTRHVPAPPRHHCRPPAMERARRADKGGNRP